MKSCETDCYIYQSPWNRTENIKTFTETYMAGRANVLHQTHTKKKKEIVNLNNK